jgi:hypothetical protein
MFINWQSIEQQQGKNPGATHNIIGAQERLSCAWCLSEQGVQPDEGSHGICTEHADLLLQAHRERKIHRHRH